MRLTVRPFCVDRRCPQKQILPVGAGDKAAGARACEVEAAARPARAALGRVTAAAAAARSAEKSTFSP